MNRHSFYLTFALTIAAAWASGSQTLACDHCGQHGTSPSCDSCAAGSMHCDDSGILDHSARLLGSLGKHSKKLFQKSRQNSCDSCEQPTCGCESQACDAFGKENLFDRLLAKKSAKTCDASPNCGCEQCEPTPITDACDAGASSCGGLLGQLLKKKNSGCDTCQEATCGVAQAPECGCESNSGHTSSGCGGLLGKLLSKKNSATCDQGCTQCSDCSVPEADCGVEQVSACDSTCRTESAGCGGLLEKFLSKRASSSCQEGCSSCGGCESSLATCGVETVPSCGCEPACDDAGKSCGGILGQLKARRAAAACDRGCEGGCGDRCGTKSIAFARLFRPSCEPPKPNLFERMLRSHGVACCDSGPARGCDTQTNAVWSNELHPIEMEHAAPPQIAPGPQTSIPMMTAPSVRKPKSAAPIAEQPKLIREQPVAPQAPLTDPKLESQPAPAPIPPTTTPPSLKAPAQPLQTPAKAESEINPFRDDAASRIRKTPAEPIRYQKSGARRPTAEPPAPPYGNAFDSQAGVDSQTRDVRVQLSDFVQGEPQRIDAEETRALPLTRAWSHTDSSRLVPASTDSVRSLPAKVQQAERLDRGLRLRE